MPCGAMTDLGRVGQPVCGSVWQKFPCIIQNEMVYLGEHLKVSSLL